MKTLLCVLAMLLGTSSAWAMTLPTLPTPFAQQTRPAITGSTFTVTTCANFKTALDSAAAASLSLNHVINVQAGLNCTLMYLPAHSGANGGWIIVRSANFANLPPAGTRVTTADAANMPVLTYGAKTNPYTGCGDEAALAASTNAQNYWIEGFDVEANTACPGCITVNKNYSLILTGYANCNYTNTKNLVFSHIIMRDQDANHILARGILCEMDKGGLALLDSYAVGIKSPPSDEAQAVACSNNPGPTLIQNNFLQASTEVIIFGGAGALDATHVPQDITVRLNDLSHDLAMRNPTNPWSLKTLLELKMGVRVLIEANTFKYAWTGVNGDDGHAFRFTVRSWGACATCFYFTGNQFGNPANPLCNTLPICPQSVAAVTDVTFRYNDTRHMGSAWSMFSSDDGNGGNSQPIARWHFHDNLFADFTYDPTCLGGCGSMFDWANGGPYPALDILFEHNTFYNDGTVDSRIMNAGSAPIGQVSGGPAGSNPPAKTADMDFIFRNNIIQFGTYGIVGNTVNGPGALDSSFTTGALPNGYQWTNNVISGFAASGASMSTYVQGTRFVNNCYSTNGAKDGAGNAAMTVGQIGFDNPGNLDTSTFVLTNAAFKAGGACQATDGTDQGVNWSLYNAARGGAIVAACTGASPTWTATPDLASVRSCIRQAVNGDTVNILAGTAIWTTKGLGSSCPSESQGWDVSFCRSTTTGDTKYITIAGAGIGQTIIIDQIPKNNGQGAQVFNWQLNPAGLSRITGIEVRGSTGIFCGGAGTPNIQFSGATTQFRLDHNKFVTHGGCPAISTGLGGGGGSLPGNGYVRGVIDHNTFDVSGAAGDPPNTGGPGFCIYIFHQSWGNASDQGHNSWALPDTVGTAEAVFIEDNIFLNSQAFYDGANHRDQYCLDMWAGARVVVRHNNFRATYFNTHAADTVMRGVRQYEVYDNTWTGPDGVSPWDTQGTPVSNGMSSRGGVGLIFNNTLLFTNFGGGQAPPPFLTDYFTGAQPRLAFGVCNGTNSWDQNSNTPAGSLGRLCVDQVGAGFGDLLCCNTLPLDNLTRGGGQLWPRQVAQPTYAWNNKVNGVQRDSGVILNGPYTPVILGIDLINCPGQTNCRPGYTPYQYPHPLVSGVTVTPPAPPTGLEVQ